MGQAAGDLFTELSSPDPNASKVQAVQYVDFALSVEDGSLINSPAPPEIATAETADAIDELLGPDAPAHPAPAETADPAPAEPAHPAPAEPADPAPAEPADPAPAEPADPAPAEPAHPAPAETAHPAPAEPGNPSRTSEPADPRSHPSPTDIGDLGPRFGV